MKSFPNNIQLLDYSEAAKFLGLSKATLYSKVCRKEVPHIRFNRRCVKFDRNELLLWIKKHHIPVEPNKSHNLHNVR